MNKKENLFEDLFNAFARAASDAEESGSVTDNGIDLSKLQINEEVFVSDNGIVWHKAYYAGHIGKKVLTFPKGQNAESYIGHKRWIFKHIELIKHVDEKEENKTDWSKVKVDTPVYVTDGAIGFRRRFAKYENGIVYVFKNGGASYTNADTETWDYNILAEDFDLHCKVQDKSIPQKPIRRFENPRSCTANYICPKCNAKMWCSHNAVRQHGLRFKECPFCGQKLDCSDYDTNEKLKPCPFCGGKAEYKEHIGKHAQMYSVNCECGACRFGDSKKDAIERWNRRA